jgi:hypothetical protein
LTHPFSIIRPESVVDMDSAEQFIKQQIGIGYVTQKDGVIFRKKVTDMFKNYPGSSWQTLVRTTEWAKSRRKRYARLHELVEAVRFAYADGYLPELDSNHQEDIDAQIRAVLRVEMDPEWRRRLLVAQGTRAKMSVLADWQATQKVSA